MVRPLLLLCLLAGCATASSAARPSREPTQPDSTQASTAGPSTPFVSPHSYEYYVRAEVLAQRGDWAGAASAYDQALAGAEVDAYLLTRYARALDGQGRADDARQALSEALSFSPADPIAHTELANFFARHGDVAHAFGEYERALTLDPLALAPALALANLLDRQGAPERAEATLKRYIASNSEFGTHKAAASLALALQESNADAAAKAIDRFRSVAQVSPVKLAEAAALLLNAGQPLRAALLLEAAPDHRALRQIRLKVYLAAHWNDKARDLLVRDPEADLGGFPFVTEALLAVGLPDRALDSAAAAKLTYRNDPILAEHAALLEAQAYLDLEKPVDAAEALQSISGTSAVADAALQLRVEALRQAGLPALAKVVAQTAKGR